MCTLERGGERCAGMRESATQLTTCTVSSKKLLYTDVMDTCTCRHGTSKNLPCLTYMDSAALTSANHGVYTVSRINFVQRPTCGTRREVIHLEASRSVNTSEQVRSGTSAIKSIMKGYFREWIELSSVCDGVCFICSEPSKKQQKSSHHQLSRD